MLLLYMSIALVITTAIIKTYTCTPTSRYSKMIPTVETNLDLQFSSTSGLDITASRAAFSGVPLPACAVGVLCAQTGMLYGYATLASTAVRRVKQPVYVPNNYQLRPRTRVCVCTRMTTRANISYVRYVTVPLHLKTVSRMAEAKLLVLCCCCFSHLLMAKI